MSSGPLTRDDVRRALPLDFLTLLDDVVGAADSLGVGLFLVGGPVRDLLLGREILDVDLVAAPSAPAGVEEPSPSADESLAARVAREAASEGTRVVVHGRFGTVRLERGEASVDIATARTERYERPGALPSVAPGGIEEDMARRDFSVNALAVQLAGGEVAPGADLLPLLDPMGGLADLKARKLRVLHERSFHDDPTRVLRAARLGPRLGFTLDRRSRNVMRSALRDGVFGAVSGDRLRREIERCFTDATAGLDPVAALRLLADWHVLSALEPGLGLPREATAPLRRLGRTLRDPAWRAMRMRAPVAGLMLWLAPLPRPLRKRTLKRIALRGELAKRIASFPERAESWLGQLAFAHGRGAVDVALSGIDEEELHALHATAATAVRRRIVRWATEDRARRSPVGGDELVAVGLSGSEVGRALARIRGAYLDGEVANREEAIALAEELARQARAQAGGRGRKPRVKSAQKQPAGKRAGRSTRKGTKRSARKAAPERKGARRRDAVRPGSDGSSPGE